MANLSPFPSRFFFGGGRLRFNIFPLKNISGPLENLYQQPPNLYINVFEENLLS